MAGSCSSQPQSTTRHVIVMPPSMLCQVRDKSGAQEDLNRHGVAYKRRELAAIMSSTPQPPAFGMLVFSCNGRGTGLYDEPHYDSRTLASYIPVPCSGFMCNGENRKCLTFQVTQ